MNNLLSLDELEAIRDRVETHLASVPSLSLSVTRESNITTMSTKDYDALISYFYVLENFRNRACEDLNRLMSAYVELDGLKMRERNYDYGTSSE